MAGSEKFFKGEKKQPRVTALVDFSNIIYSSFYASVGIGHSTDHDRVALWRYFLFNSLAKIKAKFKPDEVVLCLDAGKSWRREVFRLYKANRQVAREKSSIDYDQFFEDVDSFIEDLKVFPYHQIKVPRAEGDDVIAVLTEELHNKRDSIVIVSVDKDLQQLQRYLNVKQWNPVQDKFVECANPYEFLFEHIIKGDSGDGIPNLLSDDDALVAEDKRQKRVTQKVKREINEAGIDKYVLENHLLDKYNRNKTMIELSSDVIPKDLQEEILYSYNNSEVKKDYMGIMGCLNKYNIKSLMDKVDNFL